MRSIEEMKGGGEMTTLQEELRTASESLEEVKRMAAEDKAEHQKNQEERDKEVSQRSSKDSIPSWRSDPHSQGVHWDTRKVSIRGKGSPRGGGSD